VPGETPTGDTATGGLLLFLSSSGGPAEYTLGQMAQFARLRGLGWTSSLPAYLLAAFSLLGQQISRGDGKPNPENGGAVFHADTRVVDLHATVVDKSGHLLTNLPIDAFSVTENGVPQQIHSFMLEDVPVSLGLVIDNSGSMRNKRAKVEAAALALVRASNQQDEVFIVNFNDQAYLDLAKGKDFTSDVKEMEAALTRIDSRGGTAMRDAIYISIGHLKERAHKDKKVLIVVTDGNDNSSVVTLESLVKAAQQNGVLIYSVGLLSAEERGEAKRAEKALNILAEATGGETFFPKDISQVERIADRVARNIRNQYSILYIPSNQSMDGTFRQIKVMVRGLGKPTVRTRSGYYATSDQAISRSLH
jgi:Ca-activated chloride channel homolog